MPKVSDKRYTRHEERQRGSCTPPDREQTIGVYPAMCISKEYAMTDQYLKDRISTRSRSNARSVGWAVTPNPIERRIFYIYSAASRRLAIVR